MGTNFNNHVNKYVVQALDLNRQNSQENTVEPETLNFASTSLAASIQKILSTTMSCAINPILINLNPYFVLRMWRCSTLFTDTAPFS